MTILRIVLQKGGLICFAYTAKLLGNDFESQLSKCISLTIRPHRLTVRTPGFHPGNRSSILREVTNINRSPNGGRFILAVFQRIELEFDNARQLVATAHCEAFSVSAKDLP